MSHIFPGNLKHTHEPRQDRTNKMTVLPAKTQISLGIRSVWSESSLSTLRSLGSLATQWAHSENWSDWPDAQADLSLCWAHNDFVGFVMSQLMFFFGLSIRQISEKFGHPKNCCNHPKMLTVWFYHTVMPPNDADWMANSVDSDQTAPERVVWSDLCD